VPSYYRVTNFSGSIDALNTFYSEERVLSCSVNLAMYLITSGSGDFTSGAANNSFVSTLLSRYATIFYIESTFSSKLSSLYITPLSIVIRGLALVTRIIGIDF
jgi:hypothetical protein